MKFCTNCGYKMNDDVKFCPKCGTLQSTIEQTNIQNNDGKFRGGSEFDGVSNSQNNNQYQQNNYNDNQQTNFESNNSRQQTYAKDFKIGQPQHLDFSQSMSYIWANKFDFSPTVQDNQKSIFWWSQLLVAVLGTAVYIVLGIPASALGSSLLTFVIMLLELVLWLMTIPPIMRRLNYLGQNKNMAWLYFVPIAQLYILYLMFIDRGQVNHV